MKGLQVDPESRWQSMEDLYKALYEALPKGEAGKKERAMNSIPTIIAVVSVMSFLSIAIFLFQNRSILISHNNPKGDLFSFVLEAPEGMTAQDFKIASHIIQERARIFVGNNSYKIHVEEDRISISLPKSSIPGANMEKNDYSISVGKDAWSEKDVADLLFSFSGQWRIPNSDFSDILMIYNENIRNLELKYGSLPVVSTSGDPMLLGDPIDWTTEESYYLEFQFDEETALLLKEYLQQEGYIMMSIPHIGHSDSIYGLGWVSKGDGKTVYYPIGDKGTKFKNVADTLFYIMSTDAFSDSLVVIQEDTSIIKWEEKDPKYPLQCNVEAFQTETVEIIAEPGAKKNQKEIVKLCKEQLSILGAPFAIGLDGKKIHIRLPSDNLTELVLNATAGASFHIKNAWDTDLLLDDIRKIEPDYEHNLMHLYYSDDHFEVSNIGEGDSPIEDSEIFLYLDSIKIGQLVEVKQSEKELTFRLLLPTHPTTYSTPDNNTMVRYIENALLFRNLCDGISYSPKRIWRNSDNSIISLQNVPELHIGTDEERFDSLKSTVEKLGGVMSFGIEDYHENLSIKFNNWNGRFPEDALKTVETIYREGELSDSICSSITIDIDTWIGENPAALHVSFRPEQRFESTICSYGIVTTSEKSALQSAKEYIEKSEILTPPEDYTENEEAIYYSTTEWEYIFETKYRKIISN